MTLKKVTRSAGNENKLGFSEQAWYPFKWLTLDDWALQQGNALRTYERKAMPYIYIYSVSILQTSLVHS